MKKFIVLYQASPEAMQEMSKTPPSEENMKPWMEWAERCGEKLLDLGNPLIGGIKVSQNGSSEQATQGIVGYSILQANDLEDARSLLKDHPHIGWNSGCEIEVHETMPM